MCRYGITSYKPHYACFACRKSFKRRLSKDIDRDYDKDKIIPEAKCPECGELMADMGLDFEAPPKKDVKKWEHMKNLYTGGITFHSCGCSGPGYIPKDYDALMIHLLKTKDQYINMEHFWRHRQEPQTQSEKQKDWNANKEKLVSMPANMYSGTRKNRKIDKDKALEYWTGKINKIDAHIKVLQSSNTKN